MSRFTKNLRVAASLCTLLALLLIAGACRGDGPAVIVDGERLDESTLKSKFPERYQDIRRQYEDQLLDALKNVATQRLFELEAKANGMKPEEYSKKVGDAVPPPTEAEIADKYHELRKSGQIGNESFAKLHDRIAFFLRQERRRAAFGSEFARLKKKYGYSIVSNQKLAKIDTDGEPTRPQTAAAITVVEFTDFRCGYCKRVRGTAQALEKKYSGQIRWVIKDSPFQPGSKEMHKAANCVHKQNADLYWKYFELMFDDARDPSITTAAGLEKRAVGVGADAAQFRSCMKDPATEEEVNKDLSEGRAAGVNGTPAFFINGRLISGAQPLEEFVAVIDEELQKAK